MPPKKDEVKDEVKEEVKEVNTAEPGEVDDDGKYTDDGLAALVDKIKDDPKEEKKEEKKEEVKEEVKKDENMIPISRLNEVIDERNKLRDQISSKSPPTPLSVDDLRKDLSTKRKEWQAAIFDNDADKASNLLSEMDTLEVTIDDTRQTESENTTRALSADDTRYDLLLETLQGKYSIIQKDSDDFDQNVVTEIFNMRETYVNGGYSQTEALKTAAKYILEPLVKTKKVKDVKETRTTESRKNLADALSRQPTNVSDLGASSDAVSNEYGIDVSRLTPDQFDKLPEEMKQSLRGDTLKEHHFGG